jgi:acyl-CoA reductase-like NAD-dependent aldehyde dehydrogenase
MWYYHRITVPRLHLSLLPSLFPPFSLRIRRTSQTRQDYWPLGVIGIIIPWNYPFQNAISPIAAAIFTGNAAVVKVSEVDPLLFHEFAFSARKC